MNAISFLTNQGPTILVCILGIIFALVQREKAPKAATFVMLSLGVLLVLTLVRGVGASILLRAELDNVLWLYYALCNLIELATTAGLIFAVFCDRQAPLPGGNPYVQPYGGTPQSPNPFSIPPK
jgi:hypothetical protein